MENNTKTQEELLREEIIQLYNNFVLQIRTLTNENTYVRCSVHDVDMLFTSNKYTELNDMIYKRDDIDNLTVFAKPIFKNITSEN